MFRNEVRQEPLENDFIKNIIFLRQNNYIINIILFNLQLKKIIKSDLLCNLKS